MPTYIRARPSPVLGWVTFTSGTTARMSRPKVDFAPARCPLSSAHVFQASYSPSRLTSSLGPRRQRSRTNALTGEARSIIRFVASSDDDGTVNLPLRTSRSSPCSAHTRMPGSSTRSRRSRARSSQPRELSVISKITKRLAIAPEASRNLGELVGQDDEPRRQLADHGSLNLRSTVSMSSPVMESSRSRPHRQAYFRDGRQRRSPAACPRVATFRSSSPGSPGSGRRRGPGRQAR